MNDMTPSSSTLGPLLRAWRERLALADVGLERVGRRRTPGLRREELAQLAGVSVDYIGRLEQGRITTPSAQIVSALARVLQLTETESELLYRAAGLAAPSNGAVSRQIPPGVQRMVDRLSKLPVAVFSADWTLLHSSDLWQHLFVAPSVVAAPHQNLLVQTFIENSIGNVATAHGGTEPFERALVADLRRTAGLFPRDSAVHALVADLQTRSGRFERIWNDAHAAVHLSVTKTVHNRLVGDVVLDCDVVVVPATDLKIVLYSTASVGDDADKLELLRLSASQALR